MARKSRYLGYMKELQKISKHEKTSTKESLLDKLRSMKNREFMGENPPVRLSASIWAASEGARYLRSMRNSA